MSKRHLNAPDQENKSMATLIYLALRAYHHSIMRPSTASPIPNTNRNASSSSSVTTSPSSFGDDAENECLFHDNATTRATSKQDHLHNKEITDQEHSLQDPWITFSDFKYFQQKNEIVVDSGNFIFIHAANTTSETNISAPMAEQQRNNPSTDIHLFIPNFDGQDDLLILYSNEGFFIARMPASAIRLSVLREWTDNIINSLILQSVSQTAMRAVSPFLCGRNIVDGDSVNHDTKETSALYRGRLIVSNKNTLTNTALIADEGVKCEYSVFEGHYTCLREIFDVYFEHRYRGRSELGAWHFIPDQDYDLEIIFTPRENIG